MNRLALAGLFLGISLACAATAAAQPDAGTLFVSGAAIAAIDRHPTTERAATLDTDVSGTVAGGALGLGVFLSPRLPARAEWNLTATNTTTLDFDVRSLASLSLIGLGGLVPPEFVVVEQTVKHRRRAATGFALLGYHLPARRASIELIGGLGVVHSTVTIEYASGAPGGFGLRVAPTEATRYDAAAVVGTDVAVSLTEHAALVPQVRAYVVGGALSVRPGLGVRWTF